MAAKFKSKKARFVIHQSSVDQMVRARCAIRQPAPLKSGPGHDSHVVFSLGNAFAGRRNWTTRG